MRRAWCQRATLVGGGVERGPSRCCSSCRGGKGGRGGARAAVSARGPRAAAAEAQMAWKVGPSSLARPLRPPDPLTLAPQGPSSPSCRGDRARGARSVQCPRGGWGPRGGGGGGGGGVGAAGVGEGWRARGKEWRVGGAAPCSMGAGPRMALHTHVGTDGHNFACLHPPNAFAAALITPLWVCRVGCSAVRGPGGARTRKGAAATPENTPYTSPLRLLAACRNSRLAKRPRWTAAGRGGWAPAGPTRMRSPAPSPAGLAHAPARAACRCVCVWGGGVQADWAGRNSGCGGAGRGCPLTP